MDDNTRAYRHFIERSICELGPRIQTLSRTQTLEFFNSQLNGDKTILTHTQKTVLLQALTNQETQDIFHLFQPGIVVTRLKKAFLKHLECEYFFFSTIEDFYDVRKQYPSRATPVQLIASSRNLNEERIVALFPENWHPRYRSDIENMPVYYFIDRFIARHLSVTRAIYQEKLKGDILTSLTPLTTQDLLICATIWTSLHEYFHCSGALPLPKNLNYKATREAGAVEELRVDLNVLSILPEIHSIPKNFRNKIRHYLLAERLFYYASFGDPNTDYDAISGQILFNFLSKQGTLKVVQNKISLREDVWEKIEVLKFELNSLEFEASKMTSEESIKLFTSYAKKYGGFDRSTNRYIWLYPYTEYHNYLKLQPQLLERRAA